MLKEEDLDFRARMDQGHHENEVSFEGEAGLSTRLVLCDKNPEHSSFIPVPDFKISHLPPRYQDNDLVDLIRGLSGLVVRVSVNCTSENRPKTYPDRDDEPYPFYHFRGKSGIIRTGSGWVLCLSTYKEEDGKNCECEACRTSSTPARIWGDVRVLTANHVVFDEMESKNTTCHFFFDSKDTDPKDVASISGLDIIYSYVNEDLCEMRFVTHDMTLLSRLEAMHRGFRNMQNKVYKKYKKSRFSAGVEHNLAVIVSHPHGCSKQITLGEWTEKEKLTDGSTWTRYTYTTPTCPGSSGAPVYILSMGTGPWWCTHPHCGRCKDVHNHSSYGYDP